MSYSTAPRSIESGLPPSLVSDDRDGVGEVEAAVSRLHRDEQAVARRNRVQDVLRKPACLRPEKEGVVPPVCDICVRHQAAGRASEYPCWQRSSDIGLKRGVDLYAGSLPVIQTRAAKQAIFQPEPQGLDEVEPGTCVRAETDDVSRIRRDFGLEQDDVQHPGSEGAFGSPLRRRALRHHPRKLLPHERGYFPRLADASNLVKNMTKATDTRLAIDFCGMHFASPLVLLSGCVGFGEEYTRVKGFSNREAGAVCLKGTTLVPRLGNAPHRVYETPAGMLNAIGLQNPGVDHVVRQILPSLDFSETRFIANVSGSSVDEYHEVTRRFDDSPIDAIEINISCPNVKEGGVAFGNDVRMSARVVAACRAATRKPIITKLSPNQTDIAANARACLEAGSDGFSVINTLMGMAVDIETRTPMIGNNQGGLSGPAIKPVALLKVHQVYQVCKGHGAPIIGQGGITNAEDALEFLVAGASAVGVGTALFYDPLILSSINAGILEYLARHDLASVSQITGSLRLHGEPAPACGC